MEKDQGHGKIRCTLVFFFAGAWSAKIIREIVQKDSVDDLADSGMAAL